MINKSLIPIDAINLIDILNKYEYEAYLVGGCVRDMLLDTEPHDWDICTDAVPSQIIDILKSEGIEYHTVGIEFGTITALINDNAYEVTTYRSESEYTDGRHPDAVNYVCDIHKDLCRRDFTINAMAYNPISNKLVDDFNGKQDIENKLIRTVGRANERFNEDALRIIRALRFAIRYNFEIEPETFKSMYENKDLIDNISKERITQELYKILTCGKEIRQWFNICHNIVFKMIPELKKCYAFEQNNKYHIHTVYDHMLYVTDYCKTDDFEIKLAALLHDIGKPDSYTEDELGHGHFYGHPEKSFKIAEELLRKDLRLDKKTMDNILTLIKYHDIMVASTRTSVKRALNKLGYELFDKYLMLKDADIKDHINLVNIKDKITDIPRVAQLAQDLLDEEACFSLKDLNINGQDIMNITKSKPGKHIGIILQSLLEQVINEQIENSKDILIEKALELYENMQ